MTIQIIVQNRFENVVHIRLVTVVLMRLAGAIFCVEWLTGARGMDKEPSEYIELSVRNVEALFNTLDPSPFRTKDLARDAEDFIVGWARDYGADAPVALRIYLEETPDRDPSDMVRDAVHNFFSYRDQLTALEFRRVMGEGRTSLVIGLTFLFSCLFAQTYLPPAENPFLNFLRESLTIAGWVAMSQPLQTYLYDWWPLRRRHRVYAKLSRIRVELVFPQQRSDDVKPTGP